MRKVKKKNILARIDNNINNKLDEIKAKINNEKENLPNDDDLILDYNDDNNDIIELRSQKLKKKKELLQKIDYSKNELDEDNELDSVLDENDKDVIELKKNKEPKKKIFSGLSFTKKKKNKKIIDDDSAIEFDEDNEEVVELKRSKKHRKNIFSSLTFNKRKNIKKNHKTIKPRKENKKHENKKRGRPIWKKVLTFVLIMGIIGVLSVTAFLGYIVLTAPEFSESALLIKDQTVVYDIDGNIIAKLGTQKRESISYDQLPQVLIDAIIATEDSRFFQHNGVDLFRFIKATILQMLGHDDAGGASTLTMQTVKNNFTKKEKINEGKIERVIRKFQDVYLAVFKLEKKYSKEEIIEMYINDNGLGSSYYGVEEASKYYFGKSASELTLPEAALIAGLFQAPNRHNPYKDIKKATSRRTTVLKLMERHGYITEEERNLAEKIPIESLLVGANSSDNPYQGYIDAVVAEVERLTATADNKSGDDPATVPMKIYTTMQKSIQDGVNSVYNSSDSSIWRDEYVQGGVAIIDVETGAIAALGAGRNKTGERQFNYATQAYRQPGSTAKPIFDYGPGIEYNNFSSYQLFVDEPWSYTNGPSIGNWDGGFKGLMTARTALQQSRNIPALKAFQQVGVKNSQKFAYSLGLNVSLNSSSENYKVFSTGIDNAINEAYAIGGVAGGFTPLNMATAYACFANGGYYTEPHTVTKIIYRETGEEREFKYSKEKVMKESTAYIINHILEGAVSGAGFAGGANIYGSHVAAKTGTSNYDENTIKAKGLPYYAINDLWTVAYTSQYSVAVWYGYEDIDPAHFNNNIDGKKDNFTRAIMQNIPKDTKGWSMPSSVVAVTVEKETWPAALPSEYTPADMKITELFVRGTQPTEVSERYQKLNDIKNAKTTTTGNSVTITWDYDTPKVFTKEYIESYFNKSAFGNSKHKMAESRLYYNANTLGGITFAIYEKKSDGSLKLLERVTDKKYVYNGYGNTTLVIKTEYGTNVISNGSSNGVTIPIKLEAFDPKDIEVTYETNGTIKADIGTYVEKGFKTITYKGKDISKDVTIHYSVSTDNDTYEKASDFEKVINSLEAGTYTITYKITYLGNKITKTRNLILNSKDATD